MVSTGKEDGCKGKRVKGLVKDVSNATYIYVILCIVDTVMQKPFIRAVLFFCSFNPPIIIYQAAHNFIEPGTREECPGSTAALKSYSPINEVVMWIKESKH